MVNEKTAGVRKPYFSPSGIRERYAKHLQNDTVDNGDLLFDVARDTVQLMRRAGKGDDEIRTELQETFHFSDEVIDQLVKR